MSERPTIDEVRAAQERLHGIANAQGEFTAFFNDADDAAHEALKTLPRSDGHLMYLRGAGAGIRRAAERVGREKSWLRRDFELKEALGVGRASARRAWQIAAGIKLG